MPKATCQLNLTLDVPVAEAVERISKEIRLRPSGGGRVLLLERLELEGSGWKVQDEDLKKLFARICSLDQGQQELVEDFVASLEANGSIPPIQR